MAEVFRARQTGAEGFSRPVALKRVSAPVSQDPEFARLFISEAKLAAQLAHPAIVKIIDFDRDENGQLFIAMELVDGADLRRLLIQLRERREAMPPALAAYVASEVLRALDYAHKLTDGTKPLGVVHRDVSPANVLLGRSGAVLLSDFGIAKATAATHAAVSTTIKGKVAYMAPEQARGEALDGRADLFAVGVMLYEMLAGERPFDGASEAEVLAKLLTGKPAPLAGRTSAAAAGLAAVAERLMRPDRAERYATADDARRELVAWSGFPADGARDLAVLVQRLCPPEAPPATKAPEQFPAGTPSVVSMPSQTQTATRVGPSKRTIGILAVVAAASAAAAIYVWTVPTHRGGSTPAPTSVPPTAPRPSAQAVAPPAAPPPAGPSAPNPGHASGPTRPPAPTRDAGAQAVTPTASDAAPAADKPKKRGAKEWEVDPHRGSPDEVPR